ncbi:hypothetical protein ACLOJK_037141 [Asimina triloba]
MAEPHQRLNPRTPAATIQLSHKSVTNGQHPLLDPANRLGIKKQQMVALGFAGVGFTPHIIVVKAEEHLRQQIRGATHIIEPTIDDGFSDLKSETHLHHPTPRPTRADRDDEQPMGDSTYDTRSAANQRPILLPPRSSV